MTSRYSVSVLAAVAFFFVLAFSASASAATRTYWIAAVPTNWNVIPNEKDAMSGMTFTPAQTFGSSVRLGDDATACTGANAGAIRFDGTSFLGCAAGTWRPFRVGQAPATPTGVAPAHFTIAG